ncbi:cilia- and flagella-associated protein 90 isoform X2 [Lonchura striata]
MGLLHGQKPEIPAFYSLGQQLLPGLLYTGDFFTYDAVFRIPEDYDQYLPRCDRKHAKARGLKINEEEMARTVPVLTSSEYGKHIHEPLDPATGEHARVYSVYAAIYGEGSRTAQ